MRLFMAGGISGNLKPFWSETCRQMEKGRTFPEATEVSMRIFLAGTYSRPWVHDELIETEDNGTRKTPEEITKYKPYILESFYYADSDIERLIPFFGDFMLDSGAFTFMQGKGNVLDWEDYVERYADFITRNNVEKFFELDIDLVTGYDKVLVLRKKLEHLTGKQCIPVWHKIRGIDEYKRHCEEYPYVAIGGYVTKELSQREYEAFPQMISYAHRHDAKVHCLGFTRLSALKRYHFDSVDSTAWTTGNRFGYVYYFDGETMRKVQAPSAHRLKDSRLVALQNFTEWIKFQQYAERSL